MLTTEQINDHSKWISIFEPLPHERLDLIEKYEVTQELLDYAIDPYEKARVEFDPDAGVTLLIFDVYVPTHAVTAPQTAPIGIILTANNISFEKEKTFPDCVFPDTKQLARFDFYVNNEYIIEFDGEQHFSYVGRGWNTKEQFKKTVLHDKIKNQWCSANGIKIIRIPYTHEQDICLEDLLLETSVFIKEV